MSIQQVSSNLIGSLATTKLTGRVPVANATLGSVIQVVSTTKTDTFSTSSTSFVDITGLSASITPTSTSSKIYVVVSMYIGGPVSSTGQAMTRLMRGATAISVGNASGSRTQASSETGLSSTFYQQPVAINFLDTPASTSSLTYLMQMRVTAGTFHLNRSGDDSDATFEARVASTITVMEIAA
jgi:hypothetical protein